MSVGLWIFGIFLWLCVLGVFVVGIYIAVKSKKKEPKKCFNYCPKCNAGDPDIAWGDKDWAATGAWQNATCQKCGCEFTEVYEYSHTEIDDLD